MRPAPQRLPLAEMLFLVALIAVTGLISWLSGRSLVLTEALSPVMVASQAAHDALFGTATRIHALGDLQSENDTLKKQVATLNQEVSARDEAAAENVRLHKLLLMSLPPAAKPIMVTRVIGRNPDNWHERLFLDKGSVDGLQGNAVLIDREGLVGRVVELAPHTALAMLITDPGLSVSVLNSRTRAAGVMQGNGDVWPSLRYMEQPEKWKVGDRLLTSGLGGIFPKGLLVGQIVQLKTTGGSFFPELRIQPAVNLDALEEVALLPPGIGPMPEPSVAPSKGLQGPKEPQLPGPKPGKSP